MASSKVHNLGLINNTVVLVNICKSFDVELRVILTATLTPQIG